MNIDKIHENWTALGNDDPLWVVLSDPTKKGNRWDIDEFFETGRQEIKEVLGKVQALGIDLHLGKALDFGCGVGRLSQALGNHFILVDGVDVSGSMIEKAKSLNKQPEKVRYHLNVKSDLQDFASDTYDFIYSAICLQHIPTNFQEKYIAEFARLLKPGGIAYFQAIHSHGWRSLVPNWFADLYRKIKHKGKPFIPLYGITPDCVRHSIQSNGGIIKKHDSNPYPGWESRFISNAYVVAKKP